MMAGLTEARRLLASISVADFCARQPPSAVVTLRAGASVAAALATLQRSGVLAAPLYADEDEVGEGETCFLGFLSVADIVNAFVDRCIELAGGIAGLERHVEAAGAWLAQASAGSIPRMNDVELVFGKNQSMLRLIQAAMVNPQSKLFVRRVAVVDVEIEPSAIVHVITQFDILALLWRHRGQLAALTHWTLGDLGFAPKPVTTIPSSMSAVDSLATVSLASCSAAGVVDPRRGGQLVGNLSASDLRGLTLELFPLLALPVAEFLAKRHTPEHVRAGGYAALHGVKSPGQLPSGSLPLATCTLDTTFGQLLEQLVLNHIHRSWLVDAAGRPEGVISASDVLQVLAG